jgi:hypothetical protein
VFAALLLFANVFRSHLAVAQVGLVCCGKDIRIVEQYFEHGSLSDYLQKYKAVSE